MSFLFCINWHPRFLFFFTYRYLSLRWGYTAWGKFSWECWGGGGGGGIGDKCYVSYQRFANNNSFRIANLIILTTVDTCLFLLLYIFFRKYVIATGYKSWTLLVLHSLLRRTCSNLTTSLISSWSSKTTLFLRFNSLAHFYLLFWRSHACANLE